MGWNIWMETFGWRRQGGWRNQSFVDVYLNIARSQDFVVRRRRWRRRPSAGIPGVADDHVAEGTRQAVSLASAPTSARVWSPLAKMPGSVFRALTQCRCHKGIRIRDRQATWRNTRRDVSAWRLFTPLATSSRRKMLAARLFYYATIGQVVI